MYRACLLLILCGFGALAYRIDYDLEELRGWQYADSKDDCTKDIIIVLDTSISIQEKNFKKIQPFLNELVTAPRLNVQESGTRIGFVTFSDNNDPPNPRRGLRTMKRLDIGEKPDPKILGQYFLDLVWDDIVGGQTRTNIGLNIARKMFEEYYDTHADRRKFGDVAIVITDGKPEGRPAEMGDDFQLAKDAATALKAQGVRVVAVGVGSDFDTSKNKRPTSAEELKKLKDLIKDIATTREDVIFQASFNNISNIIKKLVAASCVGAVKCTCGTDDHKTRPFYTNPGESTATLNLPYPPFECYDGTKPFSAEIETTKIRPQLPIDNKFPVGESTYSYTFTLNKGGPLTCPYIVVVRRGQCVCREIPPVVLTIKLGETTVEHRLDTPPLSCSGRSDHLDTEIQPTTPKDNRFGAGVQTYTHKFTLNGREVATCPETIDVRKEKNCGGTTYDTKETDCCCGAVHPKVPGNKCCGTLYYDPKLNRCCEDGSYLISTSGDCYV